MIDGNTATDAGGGVLNFAENLVVVGSTVKGNKVTGDSARGAWGGGGIADYSETSVRIERSVIEDNTSIGRVGGGGIYNNFPDTEFTINKSAIRGNTATGDFGGGIANFARIFRMEDSTVNDDTISAGVDQANPRNSHEGQGGGIGISGESAAVIINTTVSSNTSIGGTGGGVYNEWDLTLNNVTLYGNRALSGGNVFNEHKTVASSTIVAGSIGGGNCASGDPAMRPIVSEGHNLDSGNSCGFDQPSDLTNADPPLEPLADNGGPTKTHALRPGSPAIDAGGDYCPPADQRGVARMHDGNSDGSALADIGAYELEGASATKPCTLGKSEVTLSAPESLSLVEGSLSPNPFTVSATVRYEGFAPAENVQASLSTSPQGLTVETANPVSLGTMNPGEARQISWQVKAPVRDPGQTYNLDVEVAAPGLAPATASRQVVVPAVEPDPDRSDDFGPCRNGNPACGGDPVNFITGNMYEQRKDLIVPGRGIPLRFTRLYNSQDTYSGSLGYGWTHSYNARLRERQDGSVTELDPQGARLTFVKNADGSYSSPKGVHDTLTKATDGTYTLRKRDATEWRFGPGGELRSISDPNGNALTFSYDAAGRLTKITDAVGRDTLLAYDGNGHLAKITDPANRTVAYGYSAGGDLTSVTDPSGAVTRYAYDASHNLTQITNPDGGATSFAYDAQDRAISTQSDGGFQKVTLTYEPANARTLVTDSKGNQSAFHYDSDEQVTRIVDPYSKELSYTWDARGNKTSVTDQLGNTTTFEYDAAGNMTKVVEPKPTATALANPTWTMTYEPNFNRVTSITDPEGGVTRFSYDGRGNLVEATDALGNKTTYEYDAQGQLVKSIDPKGNATTADPGDGATTFAYDTSGNLTQVTDPAGKTTDFSYGAALSLESVLSLPSSVTDPLSRTTDSSYDALGRITKITYPLTSPDTVRSPVVMTYDGTGDLTSYTDENGSKTTYSYDALGQLRKVIDPLLKETAYAYDTEGNLVSVTDPAGNITNMDYDALTRLTKATRPDGSTNADGTPGAVVDSYTYDAAGRMTTHTDPRGFKTRFDYDALGNLTDVTDLAADGTTIKAAASYKYDLLGRMTRATNPNGNATTYSYDALGQLLKETDPLGNSFSYAYDENGNTKSRTDAIGRITNYSYDPLDRLLSASYPDGTKVEMTYDAVGNLLSATDETDTISYAYDERDRLLKETFPGNQVLQHAYDPAGNRTSLTYPDAKTALFEYDAANRLTGVSDREGAKTAYSYNALDLPTRVSYPNGAGDTYAYDPLGRMTQATATATNSTVLARLTYAYDKSSNPTSITDKAGNLSTFTYDALDRLTEEVHPDQTLAYAYDAAGNRESLRRTTSTTTTTTDYTYDAAERMTGAGSITYAYNENGEMTGETTGTTTTDYAYDHEGNLTRAGSKAYGRDAFGRMISATSGTTTTNYLFDGAEVIQEKVGANPATYYTRGLGDQLISRRGGGEPLSYYHHDAIGIVVGLTDNTGAPTDTYSYTTFGEVRQRTGTSAQPFQYVGNAYDTDTKLYNFHARAYDAGVGRFTSKDPITGLATMPQTLNPYTYGYNNPFLYPDPSGLWGLGDLMSGGIDLIGPEAMAGGDASVGVGGFYDEDTNGFGDGYFYGAGGYASVPGETPRSYPGGHPFDDDHNFVVGEYGGTGLGGFLTNADCVEELAGPFDVVNVNLGIPFPNPITKVPVNYSFQIARSGDLWMASGTFAGPGVGASVSSYQTNTFVSNNLRGPYSDDTGECSSDYYLNDQANK